ncbi:substrate-binding periplasmic protein [Shewanella morhuae]|uniref:substrate-binding periplasmic protein n=1 Tax=Shewanella morhuae TaxID=365591 RepID=UPI001BB9F167|nr:transporter substrate-binding domain-containing protein [Shewanella morhuae]GIU02766.1 polar amino acid ABC transporter [Shewanella morhuae]
MFNIAHKAARAAIWHNHYRYHYCQYKWAGLLTLCCVQPCQALELKIGASQSIPPYVIQETNSGLELELLFNALAVKGHTASIHYLPLARTFHELKEAKLDGVINIQEGMVKNVFYSDVAITYQNCAISLMSNQYNINSIADLNHKHVVTFQRASSLLGDEFAQMAKSNKGYQEQAQQIQQVYMLMKHRADVIVMDKYIFEYYLKQAFIEGKLTPQDLTQQTVCHPIFAPTQYRFAFLNAQIRDDFNIGLKQITDNGTLWALKEKYRRLISFDNHTETSPDLIVPKMIKHDPL